MMSIGRDTTYIRFSPNPGFSLRVTRGHWLHWCHAFGFALLRPGEFCHRKPKTAKAKE